MQLVGGWTPGHLPLVDFEASCPRSLLCFLRNTHLDLGQTGGASKSTKGGQPGVRPETMLAMLSCNGHHSTAQRFLHPSLLRTAATLTQLEAHEGVEQGGSGGVVGRQRARPERQETCPAGASGRWQRMRSASPDLSSTRTRGLSVVDRGTQTSRGGEFRRNNLLHVTACGSCRAVARREDVTASHGWLWACRDNKETLVCGVRSRQHRMGGRCSFNVPPTALTHTHGWRRWRAKCTFQTFAQSERACMGGWCTLGRPRETPTFHRAARTRGSDGLSVTHQLQ